MSDAKWTEEQKRAIDARGRNLLVAAAAGAGKTAVLVERIIKKITNEKEPVDIDKLLVVTFTNAAASEMRERIGEAISREIDGKQDSKILQRQLALLNKASITTIHSFCLEVIRNNFHMLDLDPGFRIADETELILIKQEAMEEMFEERYEAEEEREDFLSLVECYSTSRDDIALQDMVYTLHNFSKSTPWPEKWLWDMASDFNTDDSFEFGRSKWAEVLLGSIKIELKGLWENARKALDIVKQTPELEPYVSAYTSDLGLVEELLTRLDYGWEKLQEGFENLSFERLKTIKGEIDKSRQRAIQEMRDNLKKGLSGIKEEMFSRDADEITRDLKALHPLMSCLSQLVMDFDARFSRKKRERGIIDFNDIEHFCLGILIDEGGSPTNAAIELRKRYEEILVDEYQDSNMVQEAILGAVSKKDSDNPNMFMVGDVKQSIYRFRQAKPELFLEKYNSYPETEGDRAMKVLLYKNFRSRREVIDASNYIFKMIMSKNIGELEYDEKEALNPGAEFPELEEGSFAAGGAVEVHIIEKNPAFPDDGPFDDEDEGETQETEDEDPDSIQVEARMVSKRILELVNSGGDKAFAVYDKNLKSYRPVEFRDIVILMRATSAWAPVFSEEMTSFGIPVYADSGTGYFNTLEIRAVMSLLQVIDNPMQDVPLLAVLRSPMGGFTEEELIDIRLEDTEGYIYEALKKKAQTEDELGVKTEDFLKRLAAWRGKSHHMPMDEFIWYLYNDTGYYAYSGAMPGGVQRQANLRLLFQRARQYEETSYKGLFNFVNFINRLKKSSNDLGSAKILGENENVVRIMSIHKSKGLEFPVVFVSGCGKNFNLRDITSNLLLHYSLGFGPEFVDYKRRISYPSIAKEALKRKIRLENLSEEMRILYVAFTRAREKLIITGSIKDIRGTLSDWGACAGGTGSKIAEYGILKGKSFLDWIGPALMKHKGCETLRSALDNFVPGSDMLAEDNSLWDIRLWLREEIIGQPQAFECEVSHEEQGGDSEAMMEAAIDEEITRRLNWQYVFSEASRLPAKITVTELKRRYNAEYDTQYGTSTLTPVLCERPSFMEEAKGLTAAERGTITHLVMQHLDLNRVSSINEVEEQIKSMLDREVITEVQAKSVKINKIMGFFKSTLGQRMMRSWGVRRELPFYIELKSTEVFRELPEDKYGDETILLQGVIDCCFEEDGGLVLIDYKTDYINDENHGEVKERYRTQIEYYTRALEKMMGKKVMEKYIYLFHNGEILQY